MKAFPGTCTGSGWLLLPSLHRCRYRSGLQKFLWAQSESTFFNLDSKLTTYHEKTNPSVKLLKEIKFIYKQSFILLWGIYLYSELADSKCGVATISPTSFFSMMQWRMNRFSPQRTWGAVWCAVSWMGHHVLCACSACRENSAVLFCVSYHFFWCFLEFENGSQVMEVVSWWWSCHLQEVMQLGWSLKWGKSNQSNNGRDWSMEDPWSHITSTTAWLAKQLWT